MKTLAYIRVSTVRQDLENQRCEIEAYCRRNETAIDEWIEVEISSRKSLKDRLIDRMMESVRSGDTIIVSEMSRLGRSISEVVEIVNALIKKRVRLVAIKQNIEVNGKHDMAGKMIITMFALMAEIERDLISERTKMGLARAKAQGVKLGNKGFPARNEVRKRDADEFARSLGPVLAGMRERGLSQRKIAVELNALGIPARQGGKRGLRQGQTVMGRAA